MSNKDNKTHPSQLAEITSILFANCQTKEMKYVSNYNVSVVEFRLLKVLASHQQLTVNQLARQMGLTSSRVSRIIDSLFERQLLHRINGKNDRRIYHISLTDKGENLAHDLIAGHDKVHNEILNNIPSEKHQVMIDMLRLLNDSFEVWLKNN